MSHIPWRCFLPFSQSLLSFRTRGDKCVLCSSIIGFSILALAKPKIYKERSMWFKLRVGVFICLERLGCSQNNHYCKGKSMPEDLLPAFALISVQKGGGGGGEAEGSHQLRRFVMLIKQQDETGKPVMSDMSQVPRLALWCPQGSWDVCGLAGGHCLPWGCPSCPNTKSSALESWNLFNWAPRSRSHANLRNQLEAPGTTKSMGCGEASVSWPQALC